MTFAWAAARGGSRQPLLWVLLALSLALNLCFVAGALWIRFQAPALPMGPEERLQRIGAELGLDPQQKQAFEQYSQAVRTRLRLMHDAVDPLIADAWSEVARPQADEAKIMQLFEEAGQKRRGFMREVATTTLAFLATLSPEQRVKFVELVRQRPWGQRGHHGPP